MGETRNTVWGATVNCRLSSARPDVGYTFLCGAWQTLPQQILLDLDQFLLGRRRLLFFASFLRLFFTHGVFNRNDFIA